MVVMLELVSLLVFYTQVVPWVIDCVKTAIVSEWVESAVLQVISPKYYSLTIA